MQKADAIDVNSPLDGKTIGTARASQAIFAIVLIGLGILGLVRGSFAPGWEPVPASIPGRHGLAYLCDFVYLGCGIGLVWRRAASLSARVLFAYLLLWLLLLRVPWIVVAFGVDTWWPASSTAIMVGSAWVLYSSLADNWDRRHLGFIIGDRGVWIARVIFGLGLIPIGLAHFIYLKATAPLVPSWLLWPVFWSYFTGATFIAAGLGVIVGVYARLAATLTALQIGLLTAFVWAPRIVAETMTAFQWNEFVVSILLTAATWVVADSYRNQKLERI